MHRTLFRIATAFLFLAPAGTSAHPGHDDAGLVHAVIYPAGHVDQIIAMVAVGMLAAGLVGGLFGLCGRVLSPR